LSKTVKNVSKLDNIKKSWQGVFSYVEENPLLKKKGLREPQLGALHAIHAHWSVSDKPATIVMPTGTGKTETMLATLISAQCEKILVVVPTDALRTQVGKKFESLGILKQIGAIDSRAKLPKVYMLKSKPPTVKDVDKIFEKHNVIITTMSIAGQCKTDVQKRMASHCSHLFIDEAHHIGARTWYKFKQIFSKRRILQFTATPFRNDGKAVDGQIVYKYPLKRARDKDYFKKIDFKPIREFDFSISDQKIAEAAVEQLRKDPRGHILMARVANVRRAKEIFELYKKYTEFNPTQIHTGLTRIQQKKTHAQIIKKRHRIIVCVDMLGEGFDLPELKIAAFHDIKKSLAATLQLAGRFTRSRHDLGNATFIANIADLDVREELKKLYAQDTDWNYILEQTSDKKIQEEVDLQDFVSNFQDFPDIIPLQNLRPAMSTVIYKTNCKNWSPENYKEGLSSVSSYEKVVSSVNPQNNTLVIVTAKKVPVDWAGTKEIYNWDWELYIIYWNKDKQLLFIHGSNNGGFYEGLAEAVAGQTELIKGPPVFRCFSGINRLTLHNVGLLQQIGNLIRYTMRAGADVEKGLIEAQYKDAIKSNIFGVGFELGDKTSIGCSYKGRIWSHRINNLKVFIDWCNHVAEKITNEQIDPETVLKGTLVPKQVTTRPNSLPFHIDWPDVMYRNPETSFFFSINGGNFIPLTHIEIRLKNPDLNGNIKFEVVSENSQIEVELLISATNFKYSITGKDKINIKYGAKLTTLEDFFYKNSPVVWFLDGSSLEGNNLVELKGPVHVYQKNKIGVWDWSGTNIRKESQGVNKETDSIQYKVIQKLLAENYDIIFNDDGPGESADVVAIKLYDQQKIIVELYHCKFAHGDNPGSRVSDLYEVCGQAVKSIHWKDHANLRSLFGHLLHRGNLKQGQTEISRFEKGNEDKLAIIMEMAQLVHSELAIYIVQPGLSKNAISRPQEELLGMVENYLMETYQLNFKIIGSD